MVTYVLGLLVAVGVFLIFWGITQARRSAGGAEEFSARVAEAGRLNRSSFPSLTGNEPRFVEPATLGGDCTGPLAPSPCTLTLTASMSGLGIKQGSGLYSLSGESLYITGHANTVPFTNVEEGYSSLGDITPAIDYNGTGTTP